MRLNQNLLEMSRKVCVTPTQPSSSRSKAQREWSPARGESPPAFPHSRIQLSLTWQSSQGSFLGLL